MGVIRVIPDDKEDELGEMLYQLQKYFAPTENSQQRCALCGESLVERVVVSGDTMGPDEEQVVTHRIRCEDDRCPYLEQDVMIRRKDSEWVLETPPWPEWDPESYSGSDEKLVWFLVTLQAIQENSSAPRCQPRTGNPDWLSQ